ncbi:hypothetical protein PV327_009483 [Microctonus hyperodae]|uniref:5'-nucleotidase n=1 Tax=Microctonus hyperodae TaxID=165561 RepID=A0AA39FTW4_MICHY|nr:hypothetical protein PV327_009483 [Microctonus hyperodae]
MDLKITLKFTIISCYFAFCFGYPLTLNNGWKLRIVHTNDMHARFEQTSALSAKCLPQDANDGKCYGGFARIASLVRKSRNSTVPTIFLNAGDTYQGSIWYSVHKWKIVARFLNLLSPDVISLGNHEFDEGPEGLVPFINAAKFPIVTANLNLTREPELAATQLKNSVVLNVAGHKVGIIGYLTPETKVISSTGNVEFLDEVKSINDEVKHLQAEGVKILIALGHSGFIMDKKIAAEVDGLDLVIGGHTNTFLYTGKQPNLETPEGLYPTEIIQKNGRKVYVVQAYAYTKYLGNLTVDFDHEGEIQNIQGDPILLDNNIEEAEDILGELEKWRPALMNLTQTTVGSTKVLLDGDSKHCRMGECNLGNLITDAMIDYNVRKYTSKNGWTDAAIAMHNSGSIRTSIARSPEDKITMSDILAVLPFRSEVIKIDLSGRVILQMLEHSVYFLNFNDTSDLRGGFMHFSGLQVEYDLSQQSGSRVNSVLVQCAKCRVPIFEKLEEDKIYKILIPDFISNGGDGYSMLPKITQTPMGVTVDEVVVDYLSKRSPVHPGIEWRIKFADRKSERYSAANNIQKTSSGKQIHGSIVMIIFSTVIFYTTFSIWH